MSATFNYGIDHLSISQAIALGNGSLKGVVNEAAVEKINRSAKWVQEIVSDHKTVYGTNTGISEADTVTLQQKILQSHSVGVGEKVPAAIAKLMLITKKHALAQGYS